MRRGADSIYLVIPFIFIVVVFFKTFDAKAGGFSNLDLGVQRCGMMGIVAGTEDPTMIYHNPAGLAYRDGTRAYISGTFALVDTYIQMRDDEGNLSEKIRPEKFYGISPFIGVTSDLGMKNFSSGIAIYFPNFYGAFLPEEAITRYHLIEGYFATGYLSTAVAYRPLHWLSLGFSYNFIYIHLEGKRAFTFTGEPSEDPSNDFHLIVQGEDWTYGATFGVTLEPFSFLKWGISFSPKTNVEAQGDINILWKGEPFVKEPYEQTTYMLIPLTIRTGISLLLTERIEIAMDISFWDYSAYKEQIIETELFDEPLTQPKYYKDSWNIGGGMRYFFSDRVAGMAGLQYDWSPIPPQTMTIDNPATDLFGLTCGVLWQTTRNLRLGFALVHNFYKEIDITDSITDPPTNAKGEGSNTEIVFDLLKRF